MKRNITANERLFFLFFFCFCLFHASGQKQATLSQSFQNGHQQSKIFIQSKSSSSFNAFAQTSKTIQSGLTEENSCDTYTYEQQLGAKDASESINGMYSYPSGDVLIAGTIASGSNSEGLLIKMNKQGNRVWVKRYTSPAASISFSKISADADGSILLEGILHNTNPDSYSIAVFKLSPDGNIIWSRRFLIQKQTNVLRAGGLYCLEKGGYVFAADNKTSLIYGSISADGNLIWNHVLQVADSSKAVGIVEADSYDGVFLAADCKTGTHHSGNILKISESDGSVVWSKTVGNSGDGREYIFHTESCVNLRPRITGIVKGSTIGWLPFRLTVNGTGDIETFETFSMPSWQVDTTSFSCLSTQCEFMAISPNNRSASAAIIKNSPETYLTWTKQYTGSSPLLVKAIERTFDGGTVSSLGVNDAGSNKDILAIRTDSAGMLPGCGATDAFISRTIEYHIATADGNPVPATETLQADVFSCVVSSSAIDSVVYCRQPYCVSLSDGDDCSPTFARHYSNYGNCLLARSFQLTDDGVIIPAIKRENPYDGGESGSVITKLDTKGDVKKAVEFLGNTSASHTTTTYDGNYVTLVENYNNGQHTFTLYKHDKDITELWQKTYTFSPYESTAYDIKADAQGNLYLYITYRKKNTTFGNTAALLKFTNTGDFVWIKTFFPEDSYLYYDYGGLVVMGDVVYLGTRMNNTGQTYLLKIKTSDGSVVWSKKIAYDGYDVNLSYRILPFGNHILLHGTTLQSNDDYGATFSIVDEEGNITHTAGIRPVSAYLEPSTAICINSDQTITASSYIDSLGSGYQCSYTLDNNLQVIKATLFNGASTGADMARDSYGNLYELDYVYFPDPYLYNYQVRKYLPDGSSGNCPVTNYTLTSTDLPFYSGEVQTQITSNVSVTPQPFAITYGSYHIGAISELCRDINHCTTFKLSGNNKICDLQDADTCRFIKSEGCYLQPKLSFDESQAKLVSFTDSFAVFTFLQPGITQIKASVSTGCKELADSISVAVSAADGTLNLGRDTLLCNGNSIVLNAGAGFTQYQWQDGSTQSTYLASSAGKYYVAAASTCGKLYSDTVIIGGDALVPLDLGPDLTKCNNDSVTLSVPAAFQQLHWFPETDVKTSQPNEATFYPSVTTQYKLTATKANGCKTEDSVVVAVSSSPPVYLGNDTSFCAGETLVVNAGSGFVSYLWNTGETTSTITVSKKGLYTVKATAANGCTSYDSLLVANTYPPPAFTLGSDTTLCQNAQLTYQFALPGASYLWNDGSTTGSKSISAPGQYWLAVTQSGCTASDTLQVRVQSSPVVALGKDTTLCEGTTQWLDATNPGATYLWQDNTTDARYLVRKAGLYHVTVSIDGCRQGDSLYVSYIPKPVFDLGKDLFLCQGSTLLLSPSPNTTVTYAWQDGSTQKTFLVQKAGTYALTVTNRCGLFKNSIGITSQVCKLNMPTAFTPGHDGMNDMFKVKYPFPVKSFTLTIYDRWGQNVFQTNDITKGWDGSINSVPQDTGTYIWMISLVDNDSTRQSAKGTITLIR